MRFRPGWLFVLIGLVLLHAPPTHAHLADEFPQVTFQAGIDNQAVELIVSIPAKDAKLAVFDGMSPVEMDRMEPEDLARLIAPVFAERCPVRIDGTTVPPTVLAPVVKMSNSRQPARRFPEAQVLEQGTLKFVARYETKGEPRRVSIDWTVFANQYDADGEPIHEGEGLQVVALVEGEGRQQIVLLTPAEPSYTWHSEAASGLPAGFDASVTIERRWLRVPVLSIVITLIGLCVAAVLWQRQPRGRWAALTAGALLGAVTLPVGSIRIEHTPSHTPPSDAEALAIFESLHRNIYRAFDYTDEGAVYDALAQSVDGPMLETIYNDVYRSLIVLEENGAVSKVVRVEMQSMELMGNFESNATTPPDEEVGSFLVKASWQVDGVVTHFGHTHARTNAFEAIYTVAPRGDGWRIVESHILQQHRVDDGDQTAEDVMNDS